MMDVTGSECAPFVMPMSDFVMSEIGKVGAEADELQAAIALAKGAAPLDVRAYQRLTPRMRRLVDLLAVADLNDVVASCATSASLPIEA